MAFQTFIFFRGQFGTFNCFLERNFQLFSRRTQSPKGPEITTGPFFHNKAGCVVAWLRTAASFFFFLPATRTRPLLSSVSSPSASLEPISLPIPTQSEQQPILTPEAAGGEQLPSAASPLHVIMLRVAGRRLSSALAWRPAAAAAAGSRGPLAGGLPRDDDDNRRPRFSIESPFFAAARGTCTLPALALIWAPVD